MTIPDNNQPPHLEHENELEAGQPPPLPGVADERIQSPQIGSPAISHARYHAPGAAFVNTEFPEKKHPPQVYMAVAIAAIITGLVCSLIFGDAPGAGLNLSLAVATFFAGWYGVSRLTSVPRWRKICAGMAVLYGIALALRASDILFTVNVLLALGFSALACTPAATEAMKKTWATAIDLIHVASNFVGGALFLLFEIPWSRLRLSASRSTTAIRILTGVGISIPFLVIFGLLFGGADARFSRIFNGFFSWLLPMIGNHFWITFFATLLSAGLLRCAFLLTSSEVTDYDSNKPGRSLGLVESATALSLLNVMFLIFVGTQLTYLFGGQDRVSFTPGLQWSEYARRGFFELAWVIGLLIPTLMLFMSTTRTETLKQKHLLCGLCLGLTALGGIVALSALQRMLLYTANFGLTELRVYVSAFIIMLACVLVLLNALNYMGRGRVFLPAALGIGVLFSIGIQTPNIQGVIARDSINRHLAGKSDKAGEGDDLSYLKSLSSDAVPAIVASGLPPHEKTDAVQSIINRDVNTKKGFNWLYHPLSVRRAQRLAGKIGAQEGDEVRNDR